jgi:hypothetical protein
MKLSGANFVQRKGGCCHRIKESIMKGAMADRKSEIKRKIVRAGGWQVAKRVAKTIPFGGTAVVIALVGSDIKKKGVVKGLVNSGIDAIPFVGLAKNAVELVTGDFIPDKRNEK